MIPSWMKSTVKNTACAPRGRPDPGLFKNHLAFIGIQTLSCRRGPAEGGTCVAGRGANDALMGPVVTEEP